MIRVAAVSGTQQHPSPVPYTHRPDKGTTGGGVSPYFPTLTPSHKPEALDGFHASTQMKFGPPCCRHAHLTIGTS